MATKKAAAAAATTEGTPVVNMEAQTTAPVAATAPAAPAEPAAPKEVGKIQKIILMHIAGYPNKDIIAAGFNKSTVAIQTSERKKNPGNYDVKHGIAEAAALYPVAPYVAPVVEAPAPVAAAAVAPAAAPASGEEVSI